MGELYPQLRELLQQGQRVALATIVEARGSTPREVGTQMIVHPLSLHVGTVGGGCGEADVIRTGLDVIATNKPETVVIDLTEPITLEATGVCGGIYRVFVEPWSPEDVPLLVAWEEATRRGEPVARLVVTHASGQWAHMVGQRALVDAQGTRKGHLTVPHWPDIMAAAQEALATGRHRLLKHRTAEGEIHVFIDVWRPPPRLIIVGAGHIAAPLASLGHLNDFQVEIVDDRPSLATQQRFPTATRIHVGPLPDIIETLPTDEETYIVLVTRGHQLDVACLLVLLDRSWAYLGMIGSQRRVRAVFQLLQAEKHVPPARLARVHAPVGLDIGAETPAEIATAIMAEIILVRKGGSGRPLRELKGPFRERHPSRRAPTRSPSQHAGCPTRSP